MADTTDTFDFVEIQLADQTDWRPDDTTDVDWVDLFVDDFVDGPEEPRTVMADGDTFHFGADDGKTAHIEYFGVGDKIELDGAAFGMAAGALNPNAFHIGGEATGPDAQILYDPENGLIVFAPNGVGSEDENEEAPDLTRTFAAVDNHAKLTAADFVVV